MLFVWKHKFSSLFLLYLTLCPSCQIKMLREQLDAAKERELDYLEKTVAAAEKGCPDEPPLILLMEYQGYKDEHVSYCHYHCAIR